MSYCKGIRFSTTNLLKFLFSIIVVILLILNQSLANSIDIIRSINNKLSDEQLYEGTLYHLDMKEMADLSEKNRSLGLKSYERVNINNKHFVTKSTDDNIVFDSATGSNGASAQYENTCLLNSTDNFFYLNTIGTDDNNDIIYSVFSKKLHSSKNIRLFYYTLELYELGKYNKVTLKYNNKKESLDDRLKDFVNNVIMTNNSDIILKNGVSVDDYIKSFEQLFISYGLKDPKVPITQNEFKVYMYKLFTDIKNDLGLAGEFDPYFDTPHLIGVLENGSFSKIELNNIKKKLIEDIKKYRNIIVGATKSIYKLTSKTPNFFYYLDNMKRNGFYFTLDYVNSNNDISNNVNLSAGYEYSVNDSNIFFYGMNFGVKSAELKYSDKNKIVYSLSTVNYLKLDTSILSMDLGIFIEDFFNKNEINSFKKYINNYKIGYFVGLNKKIGSDSNFLKISSRLFNTFVKVRKIHSFINGELDNPLLYRNLYVENTVELNIKYLDKHDFKFIPSIKYIVNANNKKKTTHIMLIGDKDNIEIKNNDEFYISLINEITISNNNIFVVGLDLSKRNCDLYLRFAKNF